VKLHKPIYYELLYAQTNIIIPVEKGQERQVMSLVESFDKDTNKDYEITVKTRKDKRTLDQNGLLWSLIGKLGAKLHRSDSEVYRELIKDNGVFEIVPIRVDAIPTWTKNWESRGVGWVTLDIGECKNFRGYHNIKCFYGTSSYSKEELTRLIDALVYECREQGIDITQEATK